MKFHRPFSVSRARSGFTLVELPTVIAIVGILAPIVIPVSSNVRAKAASARSSRTPPLRAT